MNGPLVSFIISNCSFTVGNVIFQQIIGIPMGIDPAPFWTNLFLYFHENKFIQSLIFSGSKKAFFYHWIERFIGNLCAIKDKFEFNGSFKDIHPPELEFKVKYMGDPSTFLDIDTQLSNGKFIYKFFTKKINFLLFEFHVFSIASLLVSTLTLFYQSFYYCKRFT